MENAALMTNRIRRVLLVCNNYDNFSLEEDGRLDMRIAREYSELNLSNPPVFERVSSTGEALERVTAGERWDIVITMYNAGGDNAFEFAHRVKESAPGTPVVLMTCFSKEVSRQLEDKDRSCIDYVFNWNGSTDLIIAIIKLLEDSLNAPEDILKLGVQCILLVEDSVRYYSTYLPLLYKLVLQQNLEAIRDALNEDQQILRKRARPKILLATNYDDAVKLYNTYKENLLGVISDIGFVLHKHDKPSQEKLDAGVDLCKFIRSDDPRMPILMQSSQESMRPVAESLGAGFLMKRSKTLTHELAEYIGREFGFGEFVATNEKGRVIARANDLQGVEEVLESLPEKVLDKLRSKNYISRWLLARGIFAEGNAIKSSRLPSAAEFRAMAIPLIHKYRVKQSLGVVARFDPATYNDTIWFARYGEGSLGGKARGLAFLNHILYQHRLYNKWEGVHITVPRTLVLATDCFDRFILENGLQYVINSDISDAEILSEFVASNLPQDVVEALRAFIRVVHTPLAVRSSSKLEDSYYQPFAGVYSTYMIPSVENEDQQLRLLSKAIKSVYASVYYASSRGYITATANVISEEKMAIILQEICGAEDQGYFFPTLSGVARSVNYYPIGHERAEEGIAKVAYGLGKAVVDGEQVLRFSPAYPKHVLQTSTPELAMRDTQKVMYALNLQPEKFKTSVDDAVNLERTDIYDCSKFSSFNRVISTYDYENQRMVDSPMANGPKAVTFAHILRYGTFPLADIVQTLLDICSSEMQGGVEIEYAAELSTGIFNALQVRPISSDSLKAEVDWRTVDSSNALVTSQSALGTGWLTGLKDIIYLKADTFDKMKTQEMAAELRTLNAQLRAQGRQYVLIGYGRWGSSIPTLGVPVVWSDISEAKALVECSLPDFRVDPSQGTHFFQNLTSFNAGYVNVDPYSRPGDSMDLSALDALPAVFETQWLRHVQLDHPLTVCIDGKAGRALIKL
ncbi:MAG: phosphoenolpyruvate synthase [Bacteroidales bacterium]|jgi:CheY-like chemotaxis protein|nr:phosphoenolpyruvate synthase [Bacteroidales bacterium]